MARPKQTNLNYFPMDTDLDTKLKLLKAKYKLEGIGFFDMLLRTIYKEGYFLELSDEVLLLLSDEFGIAEEHFKKILDFCIKINLFDKKIFLKYKILTSSGIQSRYIEVKKRSEINMLKQLLCINVTLIPEHVTITNLQSYINPLKESKVKESKVKESKVKESKVKENLLYAKAVELFLLYYLSKKGTKYDFTSTDGAKIKSLIKKFSNPETFETDFQNFLDKIELDKFTFENLTLKLVEGRFNIINSCKIKKEYNPYPES